MSNTNTPSVRWVVGETTGQNDSGTAALPTPFTQATNTTVPTAAPSGANIHITSDDKLYFWNGAEWVGPYVTS